MVNAMLELARVGDAPAQRVPVQLARVVESAIDEVRLAQPAARVANVRCSAMPGVLLTDPVLLRTALVNLIGPVARVSGITSRLRDTRTITSEPLRGQTLPVEVATHVAGTMEFVNGAVVSIAMSFDVPKHRHAPIELYGTEASLLVPDPNRFGGPVELARMDQGVVGDWVEQPLTHGYADGNFRGIAVADMALALRHGRPHRASGALALHALEVMEAFQVSSDSGRHVTISTRPERPAPLGTGPLE